MSATKRHHSTTGDALLSNAGRKVAFKVCGGRCPICRKRVAVSSNCKKTVLSVDHVTAHNSGGGAEGNLVALCGSCNSSKSDKDLAAWLPARLVATRRATTLTGARRMTTKVVAVIEAQRDALTAALIAEGIWS